MTDMAYVTRSGKDFEGTVEALQSAAAEAGWSVLGVHDMRERFLSRGFDWEPAISIVEICSAAFAHQFVSMNPRLALHLPCRIVVREDDSGVEVSVLKVTYVAGLFGDRGFGDGPAQVESVVTRIVDNAVAEAS